MDLNQVVFDLPSIMANLDLLGPSCSNNSYEETKETTESTVTRVLRRRRPQSSEKEDLKNKSNRRVQMKPRKQTVENASIKQIEAWYLNRKVKSGTQTLETIFEEPTASDNEFKVMSARKIKRLLVFQEGNRYTKEKVKKRRAKIKKLLGNKKFLNRKKMSMNAFLEKIGCLELDTTNIPDDTACASST